MVLHKVARGSGLPEVAKGFVSVSNRSMIVVMQVDTTDAVASTSLVESGITNESTITNPTSGPA